MSNASGKKLLASFSRKGSLFLGLAASLLASQARAECTLGAVAVLPLHEQNGEEILTTDINGQTANFILDTGAFATTLKLSAAARLGVGMSQMDFDSNGVGGVQHTWRGTARHMRVGNMTADGMVLAGADMLLTPADSALDGLFGMNMMAAYDIDLDFVGNHAIIYEADGSCGRPTVALAQPLYMVPLNFIINDRQADIDVTIDGHVLHAVVDSGAAHTVLFRAAAARLGVDLSPLRAPSHGLGYGIGPRPVATMSHVFGVVQIGDLQIRNMRLAILDQANMGIGMVHIGSLLADPSSGQPGGEDMLLGADFMRKVHLWISHSSHKLIMQYPPAPSVLPR